MDKLKLEKAVDLQKNGKSKEAIEIYFEILSRNKSNNHVLFLIGSAYLQINEYFKSIDYLRQCLKSDVNNYLAYNNLGIAQIKVGDFKKAKFNLEKSLKIKTDFKSPIINLINLYSQEKDILNQIRLYERLIKIESSNDMIFLNLGRLYYEIKNYEKSLLSYKIALKLDPKKFFLKGEIVNLQLMICKWDDLDKYKKSILDDLLRNKNSVTPFQLLNITDNGELLKKCAVNFYNKYIKKDCAEDLIEIKNINRKIKVGYFSNDFYDHATLHLLLDIFKKHDKDKFEIYAFSYGRIINDKWREELKSCVEIINIENLDEKKFYTLIKDINLDIAIDLKGYTFGSKINIFANKIAKYHINFLGYPGTLGNPKIDYIIADKFVIPASKAHEYSEKIIYLPNCYQPNMNFRKISNKTFSKSDFLLPDNKFIFCSFNNNYKYNMEIFDSWMNILKQTKDSVLWIYVTNSFAQDNILKEAIKRKIPEHRMIFAKNLKSKDHLKRLKLADLFLDTSPVNAHTTASDALRMGLPLITICGNSFASRVAGSLLNQFDLTELITTNRNDYEKLAIRLYNDKKYYLDIRNKIKNKKINNPLFDSEKYTRQLEKVFGDILNNKTNFS
jgi:predicted O-linked N-acetylglucosamine transferase (SPINDLY family)